VRSTLHRNRTVFPSCPVQRSAATVHLHRECVHDGEQQTLLPSARLPAESSVIANVLRNTRTGRMPRTCFSVPSRSITETQSGCHSTLDRGFLPDRHATDSNEMLGTGDGSLSSTDGDSFRALPALWSGVPSFAMRFFDDSSTDRSSCPLRGGASPHEPGSGAKPYVRAVREQGGQYPRSSAGSNFGPATVKDLDSRRNRGNQFVMSYQPGPLSLSSSSGGGWPWVTKGGTVRCGYIHHGETDVEMSRRKMV
jgi:hypothetical protein